MSDPTQGLPPAGWYPDPAGLPQQRWWDGRAWTENLQQQPEPVVAVPVSQPIVQPAFQPVPVTAPTVFPFEPLAPTQPAQGSSARQSRGAQESGAQPTDDDRQRPAGRTHFFALLVIGLVTSVGGIALFSFGAYATPDATVAAQNQLYGGVLAGFGAFAMLLWLAAGAIRQR